MTANYLIIHVPPSKGRLHLPEAPAPTPFISGVEDCVMAEDDDSPLKSFVELAERIPKFLRPGLDQLIEFALRYSR